jgi:hypothetical protein
MQQGMKERGHEKSTSGIQGTRITGKISRFQDPYIPEIILPWNLP